MKYNLFSAVKRHKSFSAGERPNVSKRSQMASMKTLPLMPPSESPVNLSPTTPKYNMSRRATAHTFNIAQKEGIMSARPGTKTTAVTGKTFMSIYFLQP